MSLFSKSLQDALLLVIVILIMAIGVWGVVLPHRSVFVQAGAYQLEAFDSGLAFYHFGLNGQRPFYRISPLDDFIEVKQIGRLTHLSQENFEQKEYVSKWQEDKPSSLIENVEQFFGKATPWYELENEDSIIYYEAIQDGDDWLISKTITFDQPTYVVSNGITLNFFRDSLIVDGNNDQIYQSVEKDQNEDRLLSSGVIHIMNSDNPGYLTVIALSDQQIYINRTFGLVEVVEPVNQVVRELTQTMRVRAQDGRLQ